MVTLKIREKGHFLEIPGMTAFRTPVEVDITPVSIPLVLSTLRSSGIEKFEIVSDTPGKQQIITQDDFLPEPKKKEKPKDEIALLDKLSKIESLLNFVISKKEVNNGENKEQILKRLQKIEELVERKEPIIEEFEFPKFKKEKKVKPIVEDLPFIPEINIKGSKIKSSQESVEQDHDNIDNYADLLSSLTRKEGG